MSCPSRCTWMLLTLLIVPPAFARDPALRSPWDLKPITTNDASFSCPAPVPLPRNFATNSYFTDSQHSIPDPLLKEQHKESVASIEDFSRAVVKAADTFQTKGSRAAAECVVSLLESAATQHALAGRMEGHQAVYTQGQNLGAWAVAFLKVRGSRVASDDQGKTIADWLRKLATANRAYYDARRRRPGPNDA